MRAGDWQLVAEERKIGRKRGLFLMGNKIDRKQKVLLVFTILIFAVFLFALLNRCGGLILLWKEEPVGSITHDTGFGYYAFVRDENLSKLSLPFYLIEDGIVLEQEPVSVNEDVTAAIKEKGGGRFRLLPNNDLYFSATDGHPENHEYSILGPVIIRNRYLLVIFLAALFVLAADVIFYVKRKDRSFFRKVIRWLTGIFFVMLLLPWNMMIFSAAPVQIGPLLVKPVLQRNLIFLVLLFALVLINALLSGKSRFFCWLSVLVVLVNTVYYFIPEWDYYGRRADSGAYLEHYTASSIRTPGYPVFIETVYRITGNNGLDSLRGEDDANIDENLHNARTEDSRGLIDVVRAQKCVLGAAFLILCCVFIQYYEPVWFAFFAQIVLCAGFLGVDNNYIMTECLSQAVLLLTAALFMLVIKGKKTTAFILMCAAAGIAILIRPANIFLLLLIVAAVVFLLKEKRNILIPVAGCLVLAVIAAIPAVTIWQAYKIFVWMPTSGYVEIARAVDFLDADDAESFDDPVLREICRDMLEKKHTFPDADQNTNMWQVAVAAVEEHGYDRISCSPVFQKISRTVLLRHSREFLSALMETIKIALERTRLQIGPIGFPVLVGLFLILFLIRMNIDSFAGLVLMAAHTAHLVLSMMNQPERRYIYSTEILCLFGWVLILVAVTAKRRKRNDNG